MGQGRQTVASAARRGAALGMMLGMSGLVALASADVQAEAPTAQKRAGVSQAQTATEARRASISTRSNTQRKSKQRASKTAGLARRVAAKRAVTLGPALAAKLTRARSAGHNEVAFVAGCRLRIATGGFGGGAATSWRFVPVHEVSVARRGRSVVFSCLRGARCVRDVYTQGTSTSTERMATGITVELGKREGGKAPDQPAKFWQEHASELAKEANALGAACRTYIREYRKPQPAGNRA